ncbi:MAG: type I 3-dehydroquinate dehydratase [Ruminococcus sp.]|jgi:3-dehydroquinate dehydratase type I
MSLHKGAAKECCFEAGKYSVFASVSPKNASDLKIDLKKAAASGADGIEILVNGYEKLQNFPEDLKRSADVVKNLPVLLTIWNTGCDEKVDDETAEEMIRGCVMNQTVDIVSLEVVREDLITRIQAIVDNADVKLMLSYRDYTGIKGPEQAVETALRVQGMGADLIRLIYLAKDDVDVIHMARAARQLSESEKITAPFCISAVGEVGLILRLYGERVGNAFGCYRLEGDTPGNLSENLEEYREIRRIYDVDHPKLQSPVAYKLGNVVMGGQKYLNCMMIKEGSRISALEKACEVLKYHPDIVEWRLDYMNPMLYPVRGNFHRGCGN